MLDRDRIFAEVFCRTTQILTRFPRLNEKVIAPSRVSGGWRRLDAYDLGGNPKWAFLPADTSGPYLPIPSRYKIAQVLNLNQDEMSEAYADYDDGRDAVMMKFGGELVVGAMAAGEHFSAQPHLTHTDIQQVAVRLARGDVLAVAGVYSPSHSEFTPVETEPGLRRGVDWMKAWEIPIL
jgi:hypothetical protein